MKDKKELIDEFIREVSEKDWRDVVSIKHEFLPLLSKFIEGLMPTDEEKEKEVRAVSDMYINPQKAMSYIAGFKHAINYFRTRILESIKTE